MDGQLTVGLLVSEGEASGRDQNKELKDGSASILTSTVSLCASILGAGIISLPSAFAHAGYGATFIMLAISGAISMLSMHLLTIVSRQVGGADASFYKVASMVIPRHAWTVELCVIVACFGLGCAYLVAFGQLMPSVIGGGSSSLATNKHLWVGVGIAIATPMSFAPTLEALKFTSMGGMLGSFYLAVVTVIYFFRPGELGCDAGVSEGGGDTILHCGGEFVPFRSNVTGLLATLSLTTFSFACHIQLMAVSNEVAGYTQKKMDFICLCAVLTCIVLYTIIGFLGYYMFGDSVQGNVLLSFPSDLMSTAARVGISGLVIVNYPLVCKPGRDSIMSLLRTSGPKNFETIAESRLAFNVITLCFLVFSFGVAVSMISNPGKILACYSSFFCESATK